MLAERLQAEELMDDPALDAGTYRAVLTDLARVNRATLAHRPTLGFLRRAVGRRRSFRLLDVGFGGGDMLRHIARWARKRRIAVDLTGIDLNRRSADVAEAHPSPGAPIRYLTGWRMHVAEDLLRGTDLGVAGIARRVGYDSAEAFSRAFKRWTGVSPSEFRTV